MMGRRRPRRYQAGGMTEKQRNEEIDRFYTEQANARALEEVRQRLLNSGVERKPQAPQRPNPMAKGDPAKRQARIRDMQRRAAEAEMDRKMKEAAAKPPQQRGYRMGGMARPQMSQAQKARLIQALRNRRGR